MIRHRSVPLLAALALFGAVVVAPGAYSAVFGGTPLGSAARVSIAAACGFALFIAVFRPQKPARFVALAALMVCLLAKIWIGSQSSPNGWRGVYEMTDSSPAKVAVFFWRLGVHRYRIDRKLLFPDRHFRLHFLNDLRFNGLLTPDREAAVPLRITWSGFINLHEPSALSFFSAAQGRLSIAVDSHAVLVGNRDTRTAVLGAGLHEIVIVYEKPAGESGGLVVDVNSNRGPEPIHPDANSAIRGPSLVDGFNDVVVLISALIVIFQLLWCYTPSPKKAWLAPRRGKATTGVATVVAAGLFVLLAAYAATVTAIRTIILGATGDPLCYESYARNIMEQGWLMPLGAEVGRGQPYFCYPLYPYVLAGAHWVVGDDLGAAVLLNGFCLAIVPITFWLLGWFRLPGHHAIAAQTSCAAFLLWLYWNYWRWPFTDCLLVAAAVTTIWLSVRMISTGRVGYAFATGVAAAATAATKPTFLLFPLVLGVTYLLVSNVPRPRKLRLVGVMALGWALTVAPFTLRNYVMSGNPVLLAFVSHALPYSLVAPEQDPWGVVRDVGGGGDVYDLSDSLRMCWRILVARPFETILVEARKVLFTFGFTNLGPPGIGLVWVFPPLSIIFGAAMWRRRLPLPEALVISSFAAAALIAVIVAYPWTYGYKTIIPLHLAFLWMAPAVIFRDDIAASQT